MMCAEALPWPERALTRHLPGLCNSLVTSESLTHTSESPARRRPARVGFETIAPSTRAGLTCLTAAAGLSWTARSSRTVAFGVRSIFSGKGP